MFVSLFWTLAGTILTGGGIYIAAMFVPSVAMVLKSALDFARSPLGLVLAAVTAGFFLFTSGWVGGDLHGTSTTRAAWRADNAAKAAEAARIIEANRVAAAADAEKRIALLSAFSKTLAEKVRRYEIENKSRAVCRLGGDDIKRLRDIP